MIRSAWLAVMLVSALVLGTAVPAGAQQPRPTDLACPPGEVPSAGFTDTAGNPHERAIDCAADHRITTGVTPDRYAPSLDVRRDQMATFIARMLEAAAVPLPPDPPHRFPDVPPDGTHTYRINQLAEAGVVGGFGDGTYRPADPVRRAQMASFIDRAVEMATGIARDVDPDYQPFTDTAGNTHEHSIRILAAEGVVAGYGDGTYRPGLNVRRDQMASFLTRALDLVFEEGFFAFDEFAVFSGGQVVDDSGDEPVFGQGAFDGFGVAVLDLDAEAGQVCHELYLQLDSPVTAAELRRGVMGVNGQPIAELSVEEPDCAQVDPATVAEMEEDPRSFHIQVDTQEHPDGALRAQLGVYVSAASLSWGNVVGDDDGAFALGHGDRGALGFAWFWLDAATGVMCVMSSVGGLSSDPGPLHISQGGMPDTGAVVASFDEPRLHPDPDPDGEDVWMSSDCDAADAATVADAEEDPTGFYLQQRSADHPDGAARGQLEGVTLEVPLSWADEVDEAGTPDQGEPDATGVAVLQLVLLPDAALCAYVETDATEPFTGSHIHQAPAGENGPVVVPLGTPGPDGTASSCHTPAEDLLFDMVVDPYDFYVNVHTEAYPDGAVRGQLDAGLDLAGGSASGEEQVFVEDPASDPEAVLAQVLRR